jgi:hypothetical protein
LPGQDVEGFVRNHQPGFFVDHHVVTVVQEAERLCDHYPFVDREVVRVAAWLHDVGHTVFGGEYYTKDGGVDEGLGKGLLTGEITQAMDGQGRFVEEGEPHHLRGVRLARDFLASTGFPEEKTEKVLHCIESHRSSRPPTPATLEARIVASADNVSHLVDFDFLSRMIGLEKALRKIERDLDSEFMLPVAFERAQHLYQGILSRDRDNPGNWGGSV